MPSVANIQQEASKLSIKDRAALAAYLLDSLTSEQTPLGPEDEELDRRDLEMDEGVVQVISHDQFVRECGRE